MWPKLIQSASRISWPESLIQGWVVGLNNCLQRTLSLLCCQVKSTRLLFIHSFFFFYTYSGVRGSRPSAEQYRHSSCFYEAQRTAKESEGRESWGVVRGGLGGVCGGQEGIACCVLLPVSVTLKAYDLTDKFYGEKRSTKEENCDWPYLTRAPLPWWLRG